MLFRSARQGEDPSQCQSCRSRDDGIWFDDSWRLTRITRVGVPLVLMLHPRDHYDLENLPDERASELGRLTTHLARHVQALPHIARTHVYRIGDGGAHLHVWFFARPEGQAQLYGSWMVVSGIIQPTNILKEALLLAIPALLGGSLYFALVWMMRLPEVELLLGKVHGWLRR